MLLLLDGRKGQINGCRAGEGGPRVQLRDGVDIELPRGGRVRRVGARAGAACARAQCSGLGGVRACCAVGCGALRVCALRMGGVHVGSADGHARHGRMNRSRWGGASLGAAQSAAPFGSVLLPKSRFSREQLRINRNLDLELSKS